MKRDPVIDRIRQARHRISEKCGHDPKKLVEYYLQRQKSHKDRLVKSPKEKALQKEA